MEKSLKSNRSGRDMRASDNGTKACKIKAASNEMGKWCLSLIVLSAIFICSCKKEVMPGPVIGGGKTDSIKSPVDPVVANTTGFFLDGWTAKTYQAVEYTEVSPPTTLDAVATIDFADVLTKIPVTAFGHNANTWMTTMVDQAPFMQAVTNLQPHVIRFPAGSGSDCYFFNAAPGKLPADAPAQLVDKDGIKKDPGYGFGKTTDNWRASLDNYYDMLQQTGNTGVLTMNYGYARYGTSANPVAAAAHLAAEWVRYDRGRTKYWEIGNEVYGDWEWGYRIDQSQNKDGQPQTITGKLYAQHFKVFVDSMRKAATQTGFPIFIGAVMYESQPQSYQATSFQTWNKTMLPELNNTADFFIAHNYFTPYNTNSDASAILNAALQQPVSMMAFLKQTILNNSAQIKPIAMTEWNMFATGSMQQVSNTSGAFAALVVNEAIKNNYGLAARWDLLNSWSNGDDHGLFSDGSEPGVSKWSPRPSFYYLYFLQKTIGDRMVAATVSSGSTTVVAYGSTYSSGQAATTLVNISSTPQVIEVKFKNFNPGNRYYWYTLEGGTDNGEFSRMVLVNGVGPSGVAGGPSGYATLKARSAVTTNGIMVTVPARGMVCLMVDK